MSESLRKTWWKRKRWVAATALWLVLSYPLCEGPVVYAECRNWIDRETYYAMFKPLRATGSSWREYTSWWASLGRYHRARAEVKRLGITVR